MLILLKGFNENLDESVTVTGGLAGDGARFQKTLVGMNNQPIEGNIVAIGFYGERLKVGYGSVGGWDSFGPERIITKSKDNVLYELDGQSALAVYKKYLGKSPNELFDSFNATSVNAASIGQVHQAKKNGKKLAIKLQYPGVADSISSDLSLVKPIAVKMFNLKGKDTDKYFDEVEGKLIEETNYLLEVKQSKLIREACKGLPNIKFPNYYTNLSSERIISMDWMEGEHLSEYTKKKNKQEKLNKLGQTLWDFYMFQIHQLKKVNADPHPGNFLISNQEELIAIDFGCMKEIPEEFYIPYFELAEKNNLTDQNKFKTKLVELDILREEDTVEEIKFLSKMFHELLSLFTMPFQSEYFDFSDPVFFQKIAELGAKFSKNTELRKVNGNRGSKHFIYMNRTFFGLYNLMFDLKAKDVKINNYKIFS